MKSFIGKRLWLTMMMSLVLGGAAVGLTGSPAAASPGQCPYHYVCSWTDGGFTGLIWAKSGYVSYRDTPAYMHDRGSSWYNHNGLRRECIIDHVNGRTVYLDVLSAGVQRPVVPWGTNDRIDAIGWC